MAGQSPLCSEMEQLGIDNKTTTRSIPSPSVETADQRMIRELQARLQQSEARVHQYENPFQYDVPTQDEQDYKFCVDRISRIHSEINSLINMGDRLGGMMVDPVYDVNRNHTDKGASKFDGITRNHVYEIRQSLDNLKLRVLPTLQNDLINTAKARYQREAINHKVNIVTGRRTMENQIRRHNSRQLAFARGRLLPSVSFPVPSFSTSSSSSSSCGSSVGLSYTPTSSAQSFGCMVQGPLGGEEPPNSISLGGAREDMRDALADHRLGQRQYQSRLRNTTETRGEEQQNDETDGHRSSVSNKN